MRATAELLKLALVVERLAAQPSYQDYVKQKKQKGEKPLAKDEWESKVLGKPKKQDKSTKSYNVHPDNLNALKEMADDAGVSMHNDKGKVHFTGDPQVIDEMLEMFEDTLNNAHKPKKKEQGPSKNPYHDVGGN